MSTAKKKRVYKPYKKVPKLSLEEEVKLIEAEIPDIHLPEPAPGSPFIRKGFVECLSDDSGLLIVGKTYRVNELHIDGDKLAIHCEDGDYHYIDCKHFKAIDYGPFKEGDTIQCHGFEGCEPAIPVDQDIKGLTQQHAIVKSATDTHATVSWGPKYVYKLPNENLRLISRKYSMVKNPFKKGDVVKCIRVSHGVVLGWPYTISAAEGDFVYLGEDGDRYYHTVFALAPKKPTKKKKVAPTLTLEEYVRKFYNKYSYEKLTPAKLIKYMKDANVPKELLNEEQIVSLLKKVAKSVFHW